MPTLAQNLAGKYSSRDAAVLSRAARRLRAAWAMTGGPGVKITKSDAKFHIEAGGRYPVPQIEGAWCAMVDPKQNGTFSNSVSLQLDSPFMGDKDGLARVWYDFGTYKDNDGYVYTDQYKVGLDEPDGRLRTSASAGVFAIYDGTGQQFPLEAQQLGQSWIYGQDAAGTNVISAPNPASEAAIIESPFVGRNLEWVCADADLDGGIFFGVQSVSPPRVGYVINNKNAIIFPNTVVASAGSANWRSYPFNCSSSAWIYGSELFEFQIRWNITAYLPGKSSSGDSDTFATYVQRAGSGDILIAPQWTGTPYQMHTQTASVDVWHAGGGVDVAEGISAINIRYAPNYATHGGAYVKVEFEFLKARRI